MNKLTADAAALRLLHDQHGYALVTQLHEIGLTRGQIARRVRKGLYTREAYGVIGLPEPSDTITARAMRAVLVVGADSVACRWTAAQLHRLDAPRSAQTHVLVAGRRRPDPRPDIHVHRTRFLPPEHVTELFRVPTTTVPRTMVDCASEIDHWSALQMLDSCNASEAIWRAIHLTAVHLSNGRSGVRAIAVATAPDGAQRVRSVLERRSADVLRVHGIPEGERNVVVHDAQGRIREVDLLYREQRLIIEFDGLRFHSGREQAERDRRADRRLLLAGWRVLRFTWRDVIHHPSRMAREIACALHEFDVRAR